MTILITIFAFILTIGLIVLIHEGGHYLAAKALGIEVRRFSIGMGPVLAKFNAWKTEFAVSALPIGGYVAFVEGEESDPPERKAVLFETGPRWKRAVICVAGPLMNFILAVMLYAGVGALGVEDVVPYVTPVENSQAANAGVETFDRPVAVNGRRVDGLTDFNLALISELGERDVEITFERGEAAYTAAFDLSKLSMREVNASSGAAFLELGLKLVGKGILVVQVDSESAGAKGGLRAGDVIESVDGRRAKLAEFQETIGAAAGKAVELEVRREGARIPLVVTPEAVEAEEGGGKIGRIGIRMMPEMETAVVRYGPIDSLRLAFFKVASITNFQYEAVKGMAKGEVSTENLSGPVGIAGMAGDAFRSGLSAFMEYLALISVAVGFMNLIPIPALDGGQLVILAVEGLFGRALSKRVKEGLMVASMAVLIFLALYATMNDVGRMG